VGAAGEEAAAAFLRRRGYHILARNYTCHLGELDLVCQHDGAIVFVEVKTRLSDAPAGPEENITPAKQRQVEKAAAHWLEKHRQPACAYRFDAVSVVLAPGGEPRVKHIVEAFLPRT
jgi:putative endonuclease